MSEVRILQWDDAAQWDSFVARHPLGNIYHTSMWQKIIRDSYGQHPIYIVIETNNGSIGSGIPLFLIKSRLTGRRLSSLPSAQYCSPLVRDQHEYDKLINFLIDFTKLHNLRYIEIRTCGKFKLNTAKFGKALYDYRTYKLDLQRPLESIRKSFHKSCIQRAINKAYKNNLELNIGDSEDDVRYFYQLYLIMRKRHRLLPQPFKFFLNMWKTLSRDRYIDIYHAKYNGSIVSSILILKYKDTVIYEYGASIPEMLKHRVSHFLLWEAIKRSALQGYKIFDFGRASNDNPGLCTFKARWDTRPELLPYYFIPTIEGIASLRQKSLAKRIMHYTIKNSPISACRVMANILYKHLI